MEPPGRDILAELKGYVTIITFTDVQKFGAEIGVHFSGLANLDKPTLFVFPTITVCLNCGYSVFPMPERELSAIKEGVLTTSNGRRS
jgi:hypothetical protein